MLKKFKIFLVVKMWRNSSDAQLFEICAVVDSAISDVTKQILSSYQYKRHLFGLYINKYIVYYP